MIHGRAFRVQLTALLFALAGLAGSVSAAEVEGEKLDDSISVNGTTLVLNGAGLRSEYFVGVYVAALYVPKKTGDAGQLINEKAPRRILMLMKHDVGAGKILNALHKGIVANLSQDEQLALQPRLNEYDQGQIAMKEVKAGDRITLDFGADGSVTLARNGQTQVSVVGPDMAPAMLKIWLGTHPAQDDLKKALLGQ